MAKGLSFNQWCLHLWLWTWRVPGLDGKNESETGESSDGRVRKGEKNRATGRPLSDQVGIIFVAGSVFQRVSPTWNT